MAEVIGVRFKEVGKIYYFDPTNLKFAQGDQVIVETARGIECGTVALANKEVNDEGIVHPLKPVIRQATEDDIKHMEENKKKEAEALKICEEKIRSNKLEMKLVDAEYTFDNSKILFYFTADGRVDFRQLVKDLANVFRTRIELRQIGVRDEAKMLGGLGVCGKPFCCNTFLGEFQPVSIKMAKEQGLSLSPVKISGTCGRLMCCLKYEQDAYTDLIKRTPKVGSVVNTPEGRGTVVETGLITGMLKVKMANTPEEAAPHIFSVKQVSLLSDKKSGQSTSETIQNQDEFSGDEDKDSYNFDDLYENNAVNDPDAEENIAVTNDYSSNSNSTDLADNFEENENHTENTQHHRNSGGNTKGNKNGTNRGNHNRNTRNGKNNRRNNNYNTPSANRNNQNGKNRRNNQAGKGNNQRQNGYRGYNNKNHQQKKDNPSE